MGHKILGFDFWISINRVLVSCWLSFLATDLIINWISSRLIWLSIEFPRGWSDYQFFCAFVWSTAASFISCECTIGAWYVGAPCMHFQCKAWRMSMWLICGFMIHWPYFFWIFKMFYFITGEQWTISLSILRMTKHRLLGTSF